MKAAKQVPASSGQRHHGFDLTYVLLVLAVKLLLDFALHLIHPVVHLLICEAHSNLSCTLPSAPHKCIHFLHVLLGTLKPSGAMGPHALCSAVLHP